MNAVRRDLFSLLCLAGALLPPLVSEVNAAPVSVTITKVRCVDDCDEAGLEALGESTADFYAKIWINGAETITPREPDDQTEVRPFWVVWQTIPDAQPSFPVAIQIWDHDSTSGDDLGDSSPLGGGDNNLDIVVDAVTGRWTGDVAWPQSCATGGGGDEPRVEVCFDVSVDSQSGDLDANFFASKQAQFNPLRAPVFRYGVSAQQGGGCPTPPGAQGVGVHFVDINHDGGTIMHELGHTLGLQHGAPDGGHCKPH